MSLFAPEFSVFHLVAAAIVGFIVGRITAAAGDPVRAEAKKRRKQEDARSAQADLDRLPRHVRTEVEKLLADGRIIEAVRDVRAALGLGLKEAKDVVDLLRATIERRGAGLH